MAFTTRRRPPCAILLATAVSLLTAGARSAGHAPLAWPIHLHNAHDRVFSGLRFEGRGNGHADSSALIQITGSSHDIVFKTA